MLLLECVPSAGQCEAALLLSHKTQLIRKYTRSAILFRKEVSGWSQKLIVTSNRLTLLKADSLSN